MLVHRLSVLLASVSVSAVLLAGCSAQEQAPQRATQTPTQPGTSEQAEPGPGQGEPQRPAVSGRQLLGKQDLPAGAQVQDVRLGDFVTQNVGLLERVVTKPEVCASLLKEVYAASGSDKRGLATAAKVGGGQIVQTVGRADGKGIAALRELASRCASVESTVDEQRSRSTYRELDTSKLDAQQSFGVRAVSRISGQPKPTRSVQILAVKQGLGVSLTISGPTGTDPVTLANKALAKLGS